MLLAVGGSLVAAEPASAAVITNTPTLAGGSAHIQSGLQYISLQVSGCTFSAGSLTLSDFNLTNVGGTQTLSSVLITGGGYLQMVLSSSLTGGEHLTFTYTPGATPISCGNGNTLGAITFDDSAPANIPPVVSAGSATSIGDTSATLNYSTDRVGNYTYSVRLASSAAPSATYLAAWNWGALDLKHGAGALMSTGAKTASLTGLTAGTDYIAYVIVSAQANSNVLSIPFTTTGGTVATPTTPTTPTVVAESAKPLPTWAAPILKQIPTLSKTLTTEGGKLALTDGDFSSLKSVTIGGAAVAFSIDAKGDVNIPVPAGKGGTTADLIVTFTGGKMTIQDGIKYVEPVNVAAVREAPIAGFKGNSTKITGALAETIQYAAQLDKKANTVLCTGYAASKAAVATATARAEAACGYATKVNDLLVNKKVTIVVNAKLAKTAAVGIKVYK